MIAELLKTYEDWQDRRQKRVFDRRVWAGLSTHRFAGSGTLGGDIPPFDPKKAVLQYQSWAYIAANIVARECAQHPLRLFVKDDGRRKLFATRPVNKIRMDYLSGQGEARPSSNVLRKAAAFGDDFVEITEPHPAITTLCDPNPYQTGFDQTVLRWVFLQLTGNAYLHPVSHIQLGIPETLWIMPSQNVRIIPDKETFIRGYTYGTDDSNLAVFDTDEVIHFKLPNPTNLYYGRGVIESIASVWALHGHKRTMDLAHFENRARPDWIAAINGASDKSLTRFEQAIEQRVRGSKNAGRLVTVGTKDFSLHQLNFPPDIISDPDRVLDEIAGGFGVPRARITGNQAIAGGASEVADVTFLRGTIAPLLKGDEETLNNQWLPLFGIDPNDAFLAYDNPVPADKKFERESRKQQIDGGRITINDANAEDGLEPVEGGDVPRFNGVPLDQVGALPPAPAFTFNAPQPGMTENRFVIERDAVTQTPQVSPDRAASFDTPVGLFIDKAFAPSIVKVDAEDDIRDEEPEGIGQRMSRQINNVFRTASEVLVAGLSSSGADVDAILASFEQNIFDATLGPITAAAATGGAAGLEAINVDASVFNVTNPAVAEAIESFNLRLAGEVTQATVDAVKETLAQGVEDGESISQLTQRVIDTGKFSSDRAQTIARTESARGFVAGEELGWVESGVVAGKKWLLAPGACPYCREAAKLFNSKAQGHPLGEPFLAIGDTITPPGNSPMTISFAAINGPPLHPNDRCDIIAVLED